MSASHNPGGPKEDWGIKFNYSSGEPAPERITDAIYGYTQKINELKMAELPDIDLSELGTKSFGGFQVSSGNHLSLTCRCASIMHCCADLLISCLESALSGNQDDAWRIDPPWPHILLISGDNNCNSEFYCLF